MGNSDYLRYGTVCHFLDDKSRPIYQQYGDEILTELQKGETFTRSISEIKDKANALKDQLQVIKADLKNLERAYRSFCGISEEEIEARALKEKRQRQRVWERKQTEIAHELAKGRWPRTSPEFAMIWRHEVLPKLEQELRQDPVTKDSVDGFKN